MSPLTDAAKRKLAKSIAAQYAEGMNKDPKLAERLALAGAKNIPPPAIKVSEELWANAVIAEAVRDGLRREGKPDVRGLRGVALVEQVISTLEKKSKPAKKIPPWAPPSLARWLAHDGSLLPLRPEKLADIAADEFGKGFRPFFAEEQKKLSEDCYRLDTGGGETCNVLYVGKKDKLGEYPVYTLCIDDEPTAHLAFAGFDLYLAVDHGLMTPAQARAAAGKSKSKPKPKKR